MRSRARGLTIGALLFAVGVVVGSATGGTLAAFSSSTDSSGNSFGAKQIFPGVRTTSAWNLHDAADGSDADVTTPLAFVDAILYTTGTWSSSFASNRYVEMSYNSPLPAGLAVSSPQFNFTFASNGGTETSCFYFEVYNGSTLIGTHGSTGSPVACLTSATQTTYNTAISEVNSTDIANNLKVRVYGKESGGKPIKIDAATVSGSFVSTSFTLYRVSFTDQADTTAATTVWGPPLSDSNAYVTGGNWATSYSTSRNLKFTFAAYVPSGATISSVTFNHSYKGNNSGDNVCYYFEVYSSTTLLATHGSSSSPVSCNNNTGGYVTDNVPLTEVDTPTEADNLVIKVYMKNSGGHKTATDLATVSIDYYVN